MNKMADIEVTVGDIALEAELFDTPAARDLRYLLPLESGCNTWGDEFYFKVDVSRELDDSAAGVVHVGDIGYWPTGNAVAIFFGPTPMSTGDEPVPASAVNLIGRISGDARRLKTVMDNGTIKIVEIKK